MAEEVAPVVVGDEVDAGAQHHRGAIRWTNVMSGFLLRRMCQLISSEVRTDKGFKEVHLNQVAKDLQEFTGNDVTGVQVYNHLRKWRQRWVKVSKLRELSGAHWDEDNFMIVLEQEHYNGHVKAHPKDADFLNKPIENYEQMMTIFGSGIATGKFAMGSNEPLGCLSDCGESSMKADQFDEEKPTKARNGVAKTQGEGSKSDVGNKRKRSCFEESKVMVLTKMTQAVNNVAEAIRETKIEDVHPELYGSVMYMPDFTEEALMIAFSHLVDNKV
ncbi:hypothetical protein QOZ80_5BG0412670 [Eleusine coracana subsp. coracana]|nr:hypothetical protein QOZ80_5BG0412670 [Eleusine coracana subsp. coracana]